MCLHVRSCDVTCRVTALHHSSTTSTVHSAIYPYIYVYFFKQHIEERGPEYSKPLFSFVFRMQLYVLLPATMHRLISRHVCLCFKNWLTRLSKRNRKWTYSAPRLFRHAVVRGDIIFVTIARLCPIRWPWSRTFHGGTLRLYAGTGQRRFRRNNSYSPNRHCCYDQPKSWPVIW